MRFQMCYNLAKLHNQQHESRDFTQISHSSHRVLLCRVPPLFYHRVLLSLPPTPRPPICFCSRNHLTLSSTSMKTSSFFFFWRFKTEKHIYHFYFTFKSFKLFSYALPILWLCIYAWHSTKHFVTLIWFIRCNKPIVLYTLNTSL